MPVKPVRKAVFPVAGLGTRFLPATKVMPKEMLPINDRPLIQHVFEEAREAGIEEFIFVTGRYKEMQAVHHASAAAAGSWTCRLVREEAGERRAFCRSPARRYYPE